MLRGKNHRSSPANLLMTNACKGIQPVSNPLEASKSRWCIVAANDRGPEIATGRPDGRAPVQYCRLGGFSTPWQKALHRAATVAPISQIMITACEEDRQHWEAAPWFVRPERRFVTGMPATSQLSLAAAILYVAARSPSNVITLLPARCFVAHEDTLRRALGNALQALPSVCEGAIALGMLDMENGFDEDYLLVRRPQEGRGLAVDGYARRPVRCVARHLKDNGALVSSGIMIGYAGVFAAHISKCWPGIAKSMLDFAQTAAAVGEECRPQLPNGRRPRMAAPQLLRWHPLAFPQRVFGVYRSGWSGLHTPAEVARLVRFQSHCSDEDAVDPVFTATYPAARYAERDVHPVEP